MLMIHQKKKVDIIEICHLILDQGFFNSFSEVSNVLAFALFSLSRVLILSTVSSFFSHLSSFRSSFSLFIHLLLTSILI